LKNKIGKLKRRISPIICYVCGKEIISETKLKKIVDEDGKVNFKTITFHPLMIGKDKDGKPLYRHQEGKCEPGTAYYIKKVKFNNEQIKKLFEDNLENNKKRKSAVPEQKEVYNLDEFDENADWIKHHKRIKRRFR